MALLSAEYLIPLFLVFTRIGGLMATAPFFSHPSVPVRVKLLVSVVLAYLLVGLMLGQPIPPALYHPFGFMVAIVIEVLTGVVLGFTAQIVVWGLSYAAELIGFQIGLSMAQVFNPMQGATTNPVGQLLLMAFLLFFTLFDGPQQVLGALVTSFRAIPLAGALLSAAGPFLLKSATLLFMAALNLATPFLVCFFLVEVVFGLLARVLPQADLFSLSMPLKLLAGLALLLVFMQHLLPTLPDLLDQMDQTMRHMIDTLRP